MGTVNGNWLTGAHSGRACNHENIYTKTNRKTGKCYSVKLCNPTTMVSEMQAAHRVSFGLISSAISQWVVEQQALNSADYIYVKAAFDRQTRYSSLRGYIMARGLYEMQEDGTVVINVKKNTAQSGSAGSTQTPGGGSSDNTETPSDGNDNNEGNGGGLGEPEYS